MAGHTAKTAAVFNGREMQRSPPRHCNGRTPAAINCLHLAAHGPAPAAIPSATLPAQQRRPQQHRQCRDRRLHQACRPAAVRPQRCRRPLLRRLCGPAACRRCLGQARRRRPLGWRRYGRLGPAHHSHRLCALTRPAVDSARVHWRPRRSPLPSPPLPSPPPQNANVG